MIIGIETSCDETSVAVLERDGRVAVNFIASQIERHQPFGGVVPEIASREHLSHLFPLLARAMEKSGRRWEDVEEIAVTNSPGLIGALLVGVAGAQGLAYGLGVPIFPVNHLEGHIFSPYLQREGAAHPLPSRFLSLVVSGGHSSIYDVHRRTTVRGPRSTEDGTRLEPFRGTEEPTNRVTEEPEEPRNRGTGGAVVTMLNRTRDDAIGETFDKVAKFLGMPYPGGPQIEKWGRQGKADPTRFSFPIPQFKDESTDFSYSGVKAAAIRMAREQKIGVGQNETVLADFAATFQDAWFDQLFDRLGTVWSRVTTNDHSQPTELAIAGGVAANGILRERALAWGRERGIVVRLPEKVFCTDNAAMIAFAAIQKGDEAIDPRRVVARSRVRQ